MNAIDDFILFRFIVLMMRCKNAVILAFKIYFLTTKFTKVYTKLTTLY